MGSGKLRDSYQGYRDRLVETLRAHGISDLAVLKAVSDVPRHLFVPEAVRHRAYEDSALPIGGGQTISQPFVQALYLQALELTGSEKALEIGTGSGYQTALLAQLADRVVSVERLPELARSASEALREADVRGVTVVVGDGTMGWKPLAPYDAILVSAASPEVPSPLLDQLTEGGRLVIPLERARDQELVRITRAAGTFEQESLGGVRFVPLIGRYGHRPTPEME